MGRHRDVIAAIAIALAGFGCGEVKAFSDAALPVDGAVELADAGPPDATPRGVVEVTVNTQFSPGTPQSGVTVVFVEPDGTLAARTLTGGDGKASATMTSGGSVTIARLDVSTSMVTILAVEAGDKLLFGSPPDDETVTATLNVTFTRTSSATHTLHTTCGESGNVVPGNVATFAMQRGCDHTPRDLVLESAGDASTTRQYIVLRGQTSETIAAGNTWIVGPSGQLMLTAVPAEVKRVSAVRFLRGGGHSLFNSFTPTAIETMGRAAFSFPLEPALIAGDDMLIATRFFGDPALGGAQIVREQSAVNASHGVDVASQLLPWVSGTKLDVATRTLRWTQTGSGDFDAMVADIEYSRQEGDSGRLFSWRVIAPTSTSTLVFPDLPAEVGDVEPKAGDSPVGHPAIYLVRHGDESYAQLRQHLDRDDAIFNANGGDLALSTKLTVSNFVCGRGCSIPTPP